MNKQQVNISIVCPFYNEEDMVNAFMDEIFIVLESINRPFEIICVNDGSSDNTLERLLKEQEARENIKIFISAFDNDNDNVEIKDQIISIKQKHKMIDAQLKDIF